MKSKQTNLITILKACFILVPILFLTSNCTPVYCISETLICVEETGDDMAALALLGLAPSGGGSADTATPVTTTPVTGLISPWNETFTNTGTGGWSEDCGNPGNCYKMETGNGDGSPNGGKVFFYNEKFLATHASYIGNDLNEITKFIYDTKVTQKGSGGILPPYINIYLDEDGNGTFDNDETLIIYSPGDLPATDVNGDPPLLNQWQSWDVFNNGQWWRLSGLVTGPRVYDWNPVPTATIMTLYGNSKIMSLLIVVGSSSGGSWKNNKAVIDNVHIQVNGTGTSYGF